MLLSLTTVGQTGGGTRRLFPFTVYKVRVQNFTEGLSTDIYTVQVLDVIKEGEYYLPRFISVTSSVFSLWRVSGGFPGCLQGSDLSHSFLHRGLKWLCRLSHQAPQACQHEPHWPPQLWPCSRFIHHCCLMMTPLCHVHPGLVWTFWSQ